MHKVSKAYSDGMKSSLRERGYIKLTFGLINREAQGHATLRPADLIEYANTEDLFTEEPQIKNYATLEENYAKVDGNMYFLPREGSDANYYNAGLVSAKLVTESEFSLTVDLNITPVDFKGLTIDFGDNYPVDFDITTDSGSTKQYRGNTQGVFVTEDVFERTSGITLTVYAMRHPHNRVRIRSIQFGYGLVYRNEAVLSSTLDSHISPIGTEIPQINFSVTVKNYDKYFDVDNPTSAIHFFETGQLMDIHYGYQLPGAGIEWIQGNRLLCSEWEADGATATIRCQDVFRNMDTEYYFGSYNAAGVSYYDLAVDVLRVAGVTDYIIADRLKTLYTKNPLPRVKCKEALQIIANACRCILTQTREGVVEIKTDAEVTDFTMTKADMTTSPKAIKTEVAKEVIVPCYSYQAGTEQSAVVDEEIEVEAGESVTFYTKEAAHDYSTTVGTITESGSYYVTIKFPAAGTFRVSIKGYRYTVTERQVRVNLRDRGKTVRWENPLVSDIDMASDLAQWIGGYHTASVEYEYSTRGNPEIDVMDVIYQDNDFREGMQVMVYKSKLNFNQAFSGEVAVRRLGD